MCWRLTPSRRSQLAITPSPISISGCNTNSEGDTPHHAFDDGRFFGETVYLGELRTDEMDRLIFLGGRGDSAPAKGFEHAPLPGFGNNPWWHDDTSDGPVFADVHYQDRHLEVEHAWVLTAPPNYALGIPANVTGYDLLYDVAARMDPSLKPTRPSFAKLLWPTECVRRTS